VDSVAHCGGSLAGDFMFSVGYVDVSQVGLNIQCSGTKEWKALEIAWNISDRSFP